MRTTRILLISLLLPFLWSNGFADELETRSVNRNAVTPSPTLCTPSDDAPKTCEAAGLPERESPSGRPGKPDVSEAMIYSMVSTVRALP